MKTSGIPCLSDGDKMEVNKLYEYQYILEEHEPSKNGKCFDCEAQETDYSAHVRVSLLYQTTRALVNAISLHTLGRFNVTLHCIQMPNAKSIHSVGTLIWIIFI